MRVWQNIAFVALLGCGVEGVELSISSETSTAATTSTTTMPTTGASCSPGEVVCLDGEAQVCEVEGVFGAPKACEGPCLSGIGCTDCEPGASRCGESSVEACDDQGAWETEEVCNPAQGISCDPATNRCTGMCLPENLHAQGFGPLGCEFYAVSSGTNIPTGVEVLGVYVVNPGDGPATVRAERSLWSGLVVEVLPHAAVPIILPWDLSLVLPGGESKISKESGIHIQSTRPVLVVQHNALFPVANNDASLLLPVSAWGTDYAIVDHGDAELPNKPGIYNEGAYVVVAAEDGTQVELVAPEGTTVHAMAGIEADGNGQVILDAGDVLQLLAAGATDLTGSSVRANRPVQVLATHRCAFVPIGVEGCDKLEEAMPPITALGRTHVVVSPVSHADPTVRRPQVVRIVAVEPATSLMFTPAVAPLVILDKPGEFFELAPSDESFVVESSAPVLVAQYMVGSALDSSQTDPSMTVTPAVERFQTEHVIHSVPGWVQTDVDLVAMMGTVVLLDGEEVGMSPIVGTEFALGHVRLPEASMASVHVLVGDGPIGASIYSGQERSGKTTSYWRPVGYAFEP